MKIAINDANILIDLMKIDLIDEFFRLNFEFITTIDDKVSVKGILFVFDCLIENEIITKQLASEKLTQLISLNTRLPKNECEVRLNLWK